MTTTRNCGKYAMSLVGVMVMGAAAAGCGEQTGAADEGLVQVTSALHGTATFNFVKTADWGTGYNARVDITNAGTAPLVGWSTEFDMPKNVQVNVSGLPACSAAVSDNCWLVVNDIGPENIVRIFRLDPSNVIGVGQTQSIFLFGTYEAAFAPPTRCRAPHTDTPVGCNGTTSDVTPPSAASNLQIFGVGSTLVEPACPRISFTAAGRASSLWVASHTSPMPPLPMRRSRR